MTNQPITPNEWGSGPIAFAHLYVEQCQLEDTISDQFDLEAAGVSLITGWAVAMR